MDEHKDKHPTEISKIVLNKRWNLKKRKELYTSVHGNEYDGLDL